MTKDELKGFLLATIIFAIVQWFLGTFEYQVFIATSVIVFCIAVIYKTFKHNN